MMDSIKKLVLTLNEYLYTLRVARLVSFGYSALGVVLFAGITELWSHRQDLLNIFIFVGFLVYGGLYALNKYFDLEEDLSTSYKKGLSIKEGVIPHDSTLFIGISHIVIGYIGVLIFLPELYLITFLLIVINLFYTTYLKKKSRLLAIILIASTGPLKSLLGITLVSALTPNIVIYMVVHYLFSIVIHALKQGYKDRMKEALIKTLENSLMTAAVILSIYSAIKLNDYLAVIITILGLICLALFRRNDVARLFLR
ncbi:MAG TPA: UbiA family prenyltransferase [Candidatus Dojkabacteria bacterium]|nr:UbiA family prenyltransferase [Candidatus Dojkabacteria bacterium]